MEKVAKTATETATGNGQPFNAAGRSVTFDITPRGAVTLSNKAKRQGLSPALSLLTFPAKGVRIGDSWPSSIRLVPWYQGVTSATITANNTFSGLEYFLGRPAAKIVSNYDGNADVTISGAATTAHFKGTRVTYFDHVKGRLLKSTDTLTADFTPAGSGGLPPPGGLAPGGGGTPGTGIDMTIVNAAR